MTRRDTKNAARSRSWMMNDKMCAWVVLAGEARKATKSVSAAEDAVLVARNALSDAIVDACPPICGSRGQCRQGCLQRCPRGGRRHGCHRQGSRWPVGKKGSRMGSPGKTPSERNEATGGHRGYADDTDGSGQTVTMRSGIVDRPEDPDHGLNALVKCRFGRIGIKPLGDRVREAPRRRWSTQICPRASPIGAWRSGLWPDGSRPPPWSQ